MTLTDSFPAGISSHDIPDAKVELIPDTRPTFADLGLRGARCLLVASTGGHLAEISRIASVIRPADDSVLVTFDSPQSRSLDFPGEVRFVPYIAPRDVMGTMRASRYFHTAMKSGWDAVVSTGSAVALAALPVAVARRTRAIYVESFSRYHGPSMTGSLLRGLRGPVELYTQHESWSSGAWRYTGSLIDSVHAGDTRQTEKNTIFVTLGTIAPYRFDALVDSVVRNLPKDVDVVWQLGSTTRDDLPGQVFEHMSRTEFLEAANGAGRVISHAGAGTAIELIELGHRPILVPRRASRREHVDDHQAEIVDDLRRRDLIEAREVETLSPEDLAPAC